MISQRCIGSKAKGFTLIELLVVMAIIGILAGMLFPAISMIKKSRAKAQCANNLRQLGMGVIQYAQGNNSILPGSLGSANGSWDKVTVDLESTDPLNPMRFPFLKCPEDSASTRTMASALAAGISGGRSYVMTQKSGAANGFIDLSASPTSRLLVEATIPGATILLTESWSSNNGTLTGNSTQGYFSTSAITGYTSTASIPQLNATAGSFYHGSAINYLMADGRIQALNPKLVAVTNPAATTDPHWKVIR